LLSKERAEKTTTGVAFLLAFPLPFAANSRLTVAEMYALAGRCELLRLRSRLRDFFLVDSGKNQGGCALDILKAFQALPFQTQGERSAFEVTEREGRACLFEVQV
jgi:hypothetical protein